MNELIINSRDGLNPNPSSIPAELLMLIKHTREEVLLHKSYIRTNTKLEKYLKSSKIYVSNTRAAEKWAVTQLLIKHNGLISLTRHSQSELVTPTGCQWTNKRSQWKETSHCVCTASHWGKWWRRSLFLALIAFLSSYLQHDAESW